MVYDKIVTKNGHIMLTLEDEGGTAKVLVYKPQSKGQGSVATSSSIQRRRS